MCNARLSFRSPLRSRRWRIVFPEVAGIGAAPASLANAASDSIRPRCDQERDQLRGGVRSDTGLIEQLWCELARDRFDLVCEFAFLGGQGKDASGDRAQREQAA